MIKRLLSYFFPIPHKVVKSPVSEQLEITWLNGKLILDTKHANYSYGSLQKILRYGLQQIGFDNIRDMQNILILGVGGGSVIKTLLEEIKFEGMLTGVDLDPVVLQIAKKYFDLKEDEQLKLYQQDALNFIMKNNEQFDLIIIDIFQDIIMPDFLFEKPFIDHIKKSMSLSGTLLFNTIVYNQQIQEKIAFYKYHFHQNDYKIYSFPEIEEKNELIIIQKK